MVSTFCLLPLDSRWGFARDIIGDSADTTYFIDNASGDMP